jgi:hypothetical protein
MVKSNIHNGKMSNGKPRETEPWKRVPRKRADQDQHIDRRRWTIKGTSRSKNKRPLSSKRIKSTGSKETGRCKSR